MRTSVVTGCTSERRERLIVQNALWYDQAVSWAARTLYESGQGVVAQSPFTGSLAGVENVARRRPDDYEDSAEYRALQQALGRRMYRLRRATGLTQRQFAELAGISSTNYSIVEAGAGNVTLLILDRVAKALRVPIVELFDEAPGSPTSDMEGLIVRLMADLDRVRMFFGTFGEDIGRINEKLKALGSGDEGNAPNSGKRAQKDD